MKKKILIVVHTNTWFTEMNRVAELVLKSDQFTPLVHFAAAYPTVGQDIQKLKNKGIPYSTSWPFEVKPIQHTFFSRLVHVGHNYLERIFHFGKISRFLVSRLRPLTSPFQGLVKSYQDISEYKKRILGSNVSLVVMGGDLVGYNTPEVAKAAYEANVACVIVPSTMSDGTEQAEAYFFNPQFSVEKFSNRMAGWLWPKWKKYHKGKWLVRVPANQIVTRQLLKTDPPLPWISSSTRADAIAVESRAMRDYYARCGIAEKWLHLTGSLANDSMAEVLRSKDVLKVKLMQELGLDSAKKIILTPLPPDSLYMMGGRPECEFKTYEELTRFWVQTLAKAKKFNTVISLHPSVNIEDFRYLESENVKISKLAIVDLIPLCDLFVASVSSTIRWAITCAKPVVNYDLYFYRYQDFNAVKGVVLLEKSEDYIQTILKLNDLSSGYLEHLNQEIQTQAAYWGCLDGHEGQRILKLFEDEINKKLKI